MLRLDNTSEQNILNMLMDHSLISSEQMHQITTMSKEVGKSKLETAFELNLATEKKILKLLSTTYSLPIVDLKLYKVDEKLKEMEHEKIKGGCTLGKKFEKNKTRTL